MFNLKNKPGLLIILFSQLLIQCSHSHRISPSVYVSEGAVNGVVVKNSGKNLVVYGDPFTETKNADMVLYTHFRRDVNWAGSDLVKRGVPAVVPEAEKVYFTGSDSLWKAYQKSRFHDYYCQTTKFGTFPQPVGRYVTGGEIIRWQDIDFKVLNTPGFTRGSVSYLAEIDGKKFAFTGDLIYGDGKIFDLYSYQDSFQKIGGYHGYASRVGQLISSLRLIAAQKPDFIIPSRGPVIKDADASIQKLIQTIRQLYSNYLSTSAYRWYYPERIGPLSDSILGSSAKVDWMPYSSVILEDTPSWYMHISNSNLVFADDSSAFLIDCGTKDAYAGILNMKNSGRLKHLDGIFITHYHDDHTDMINDVVKEFGCPVYVTGELKDILENPGAYQLPCLTTDPILNLTIMKNGQQMAWKDFTLTFNYFPGQTLYHDALLFDKKDGQSIFFIGDSFTPSGIDDYCLLNRNFLHPGTGYFYCLDILKKLPPDVLLSNQHVEPLFTFSRQQLDYMTGALLERCRILKELFPFDDLNYGIDEQWARIYPYAQKSAPGGSFEYSVKIFNHSETAQTFFLDPVKKEGFDVEPEKASLVVGPLSEGGQKFKIKVSENVPIGTSVLMVNVKFANWDLHNWCESIVEIIH